MSIQKEDVYETEDFLVPEVVDNEERFENPDIEKIHVDIDGAMKLFGGRLLNAEDVDFSDSLKKKKRRGYRSGNYVLEIVGTEDRSDETPAQKLQRLRYEIDELTESLNQESNKPFSNDPVVSKADLESLNDLLKAAMLRAESGSNSKLIDEGSKNDGSAKNPSKRAFTDVEWKSLDERIKRIENTVNGKHHRTRNEPLVETIDNLRIQVESLNPVYLEGVKNQLNTAIAKLAEFDDKRKKIPTLDYEDKVNELYKLISKWDATCSNVPTIVKRLYSLSKLHEQAQDFAVKLNDVTLVKQHLEKKTENHKIMLFELKRESAQIVDELSTKITKLESRIAALQV